jgi:polysaccharide deacetylase family protein (PEP-CTERM system associated)
VNDGDPRRILLTVDFEGGDRGLPTKDGSLERLTGKLLDVLERHSVRATFFVVGAVARDTPQLVERIAAGGHEIALHSCRHTRLADLGHAGFAADVDEGLELLAPFCREGRVLGFRAPFFSLTPRTTWAFEVLKQRGFAYDSSVLPAWHPVCGSFAGHPREVTQHASGLWIVPVSVLGMGPSLGVPVGGGVYLRLLPLWLHSWAARRYQARGEPLMTYLHPYDVQPGAPTGAVFGDHAFLNAMLKVRRERTLPMLERIMQGAETWRVIDFVRQREAEPSSNGR